MIDYIIVGSGLAGIAFAEICLQENKSFVVYDLPGATSTRVAGGLYNPVILKRFSEVWKAKEQMEYATPFYKSISHRIQKDFDFPLAVYRKFVSVEEQNNWFLAADKPNLASFLSSKINHKHFNGIDAPYGYGEVFNTGYMDLNVLLDSYHASLLSQGLLLQEKFDYDQLRIQDDCLAYQQIQAKNLVFSEGFGLHANPFFNDLPLDGTKGELLTIKAPLLDLDVILNSSIFILPIGNQLFKVGATYNWVDKTNTPTEEGKQELLTNLKEVLHCEFEVVEHLAGVRPTVKDRRPMVGTHSKHKRLHVLNGLGTRGVMLGPWLAQALFDNIEHEKPLDPSMDIQRFYKKK